jgi:hypothetical protein
MRGGCDIGIDIVLDQLRDATKVRTNTGPYFGRDDRCDLGGFAIGVQSAHRLSIENVVECVDE